MGSQSPAVPVTRSANHQGGSYHEKIADTDCHGYDCHAVRGGGSRGSPGEPASKGSAPGRAGEGGKALPLEDGMLLLGESEYGDMGWMARVGKDGSVFWVLEEEGGGVFRSARVMPDGNIAAPILRVPEGSRENTATFTS